jgi:hypothetical protein
MLAGLLYPSSWLLIIPSSSFMAKPLGDIVGSHANQAHSDQARSSNKLVSSYCNNTRTSAIYSNETSVVREKGKSCFSSWTCIILGRRPSVVHVPVCTIGCVRACVYNDYWYNVPHPGVGEPRPLLGIEARLTNGELPLLSYLVPVPKQD